MADVELVAVERISAVDGLVEPGGTFTTDELNAERLVDRGAAAKPGSKDAKSAAKQSDDAPSE